MTNKYANIIIDISHEKVDKTFQYMVPPKLREEIKVGQEVFVPFGRGNKERKGYVVELTDKAEFDENRLKKLQGIVPDSVAVEGQLIELAGWIRKTYGSTMIQALKTVLPVKDKVQQLTKQKYRLALSREMALGTLASYKKDKRYRARVRLLEALLEHPVLESDYVRETLKIATSTIQALAKDGVLTTDTALVYRNPVRESEQTPEYPLTPLQEEVVERIHAEFTKEDKKPFLLHGITGSGKTEVYVELVARAAQEGKTSIVLIPEIALTKQLSLIHI